MTNTENQNGHGVRLEPLVSWRPNFDDEFEIKLRIKKDFSKAETLFDEDFVPEIIEKYAGHKIEILGNPYFKITIDVSSS